MRMTSRALCGQVLASCLAVSIAVANVPDRSTVRLPPGVSVTATCVYRDDDTQPRIRYEVDVTEDWVQTRVFTLDGSVGKVLQQYMVDTLDGTTSFDPRNRRASKLSRLAETGNSSADFVSPIGALRTLETQSEQGREPVLVRRNGMLTYTVEVPRVAPEFVVSVDAGSGEVRRVAIRGPPDQPENSVECEYLDWRELPSGSRHPMRVVVTTRSPGFSSVRDITIDSLEILPSGLAPPEVELPADVLIENLDTGTLSYGDGRPAEEVSGESTGRRRGFSPRTWLAALGVGVLVLAGLVWQLKRRGIIA